MKRIKYVLTFLVLIFIIISSYYLYCALEARSYTKKVIIPDLKEMQWRRAGFGAVKFQISASELSKKQREILIKVQDPGFYRHNGIDLSTPGAGLTTITQAIVKKLYFKKFKPGIAKIKQSVIAYLVVDSLISKDHQLTFFLNTMFFGKVKGKAVVGIQHAANAYYNKDLKNLSEDEYISIIAMIVMPGTFNIIKHPEWNKERVRRIKEYIAGKYRPKGLMDQFYGDLPKDVVDHGLPPASYFGKTKK